MVRRVTPPTRFDTRERPSLWFAATEDDAPDTGVYQRTHTHQARFRRDVQRGPGKAVVPQLVGTISQRQDFRMRCRVMEADGIVVRDAQYVPLMHQHGPHRHLSCARTPARRRQRHLHQTDIVADTGCTYQFCLHRSDATTRLLKRQRLPGVSRPRRFAPAVRLAKIPRSGGSMLQIGDEVVIMSAAGIFRVIAIDGPAVTIENAEGVRKLVLEGSVRTIDRHR